MPTEGNFERADKVEAREERTEENETPIDKELDKAGGCGLF